jgi:hypothetical protein
MSWTSSTTIPSQVERMPQKQQHLGAHFPPAISAIVEGIPLPPPSREYKKGCNIAGRKPFPILASTYCTHSFYQLAEAPCQLPPPIWNLDDDTLTPPTPSSTNHQHCWNKRKPKAKPLEHKYTHTAFCQDPYCTYHN